MKKFIKELFKDIHRVNIDVNAIGNIDKSIY
jgi:hypothetical protein